VNAPEDALERLQYDHRENALTCYDHPEAYCCVCGAHEVGSHRAHLAQVIAEYVAEREAQAWDAALDHVWELSDPISTIDGDPDLTTANTCADVRQAKQENPYKARAEALGAAESAGEGENGGPGGREAERGCTGDSWEEA
jgi:hypothetical protein